MLYAAATESGAFAESFQRTPGRQVLAADFVSEKAYGIVYTARHDDAELCYAMFERAKDAIVTVGSGSSPRTTTSAGRPPDGPPSNAR